MNICSIGACLGIYNVLSIYKYLLSWLAYCYINEYAFAIVAIITQTIRQTKKTFYFK